MTTKVLRYTEEGEPIWVEIEPESRISSVDRENKPVGEDLSMGKYIDKYGGIESTIDGSVHTSERSYKEHLKQNNCFIKDW